MKLILILPFVILQIAGLLVTLVLLAAYFKGYVLLFIGVVILSNFIILKFWVFRGNQYADVKLLYNQYDDKYHTHRRDFGKRDSSEVFERAFLTSWLSPNTVWSNNFACKTYFLLASSATTISSLMVYLACSYILLSFEDFAVSESVPVLHCFKNTTNLQSLSDGMLIKTTLWSSFSLCQDKEHCRKVIRICSKDESPNDIYFQIASPVAFSLLVVSFLSSICLQLLGSYHVMYRWSKIIFCKKPIVNFILLHDFMRNFKTMNPSLKDEMQIIFDQVIETEKSTINQKDPLHGESLLHAVYEGKCYDEDLFIYLEKMMILEGDFYLRNIYSENIYDSLLNRIGSTESVEERMKLLTFVLKLQTKLNNQRIQVWQVQLMHKLVEANKLWLLCLMNIVGRQMSPANENNGDYFIAMLHRIEREGKSVLEVNRIVKYLILNTTNKHGQSLVYIATEKKMLKSLQILISNDAAVNDRNFEDGSTPLHLAAHDGKIDCLRLLLEKKALVNSQDFGKHTPLHRAVQNSKTECANLLISFHANVNAKNRSGTTPLHVACFGGKCFEILKLLIDNGADVNAKDNFQTAPLHYAAHFAIVDFIQYLIDHGADVNANEHR